MKTIKLVLVFLGSIAIASCGGGGGGGSSTPNYLDPTFGAGGKVRTNIGVATEDYVNSIAIQTDGKIVAAGVSHNGSDNDFALTRYNINGSLDTTFDTDGKVVTDIATGSVDVARSIAIQADGKIVVAGSSGDDFALARYTDAGVLDTTFDTDGKVTTAIGTGLDEAYSVAIQADKKIVVAGYSFNGVNNDFALTRYNINGSLDTTFDTDGKVTTAIGTGLDEAYSVAIQADNKIVVAGYSFNGVNNDFALTRYNINGSLDTTFDTDGKVVTDIGTLSIDAANSVAIQSNGMIVAAGSSDNDFALARYDMVDGSLDISFDFDGKVTTAIGSSTDNAYSVAIQTGGKIVAAGRAFKATKFDFALTRYNTDGSLDTSFGAGGKLTTAIGSSDEEAHAVAIQNGKIVAAGFSPNNLDDDFALVRYLP